MYRKKDHFKKANISIVTLKLIFFALLFGAIHERTIIDIYIFIVEFTFHRFSTRTQLAHGNIAIEI